MSSLHQLIPATTSNTFTLLLLLLLISIHPHSSSPTNHPSIAPTSYPNPSPTPEPTPNPTALPTPEPTNKPNTPIPTLTTLHPTSDPTEILSPTTETPSNIPTSQPTSNPTLITISPTLNPTSNTTHNPTTRIPTTGFPTTRFPKTRFPTTNVPTSNSTEITISTLMPSTDGAQCFIGEPCMKTGECCLGNIEKKKGVHCSCTKNKCQYKQCCIDIGYNGCFHDDNCCDADVPVICSNGQCIKHRKQKKKKKHSALINDKDGDNAMLQTFDSVTANDNLIWILIGVSVYFMIMIILFGVYKFVESKKINIYTENDEVGGTIKDDYI